MKKQLISIGLAAIFLAAGLFCVLPSDSDADPSVYVAHSYKVKFISTATNAQHVKWDFGDGTVLDSRSADPGYAALLAAHGGNVWAPEHQFEDGVNKDYTVKQTVFNPYNGGSEDTYTQICRIVGPPVITFDGVDADPVTVPYVDFFPVAATKPADPVRDGYEFVGWYSDVDKTDDFDWSAPIAESVTVYAKWSPVGGGGNEGEGGNENENNEESTVKILNGTSTLIIILAILSIMAAIFTRSPTAALVAVVLVIVAALGTTGHITIPELISGFKGVKI